MLPTMVSIGNFVVGLATRNIPRILVNHQQVRTVKKNFRLRAGAYGAPPLFTDDQYLEAKDSDQSDEIRYQNFRFATLCENNSVFRDETFEKFIRHMLRDGRRHTKLRIMHDTFYDIKCTQLKRLRKQASKGEVPENEEEKIETDPMVLFLRALDNIKPKVITQKVRRGGATYQVPYPVTEQQSLWYAFRWLHDTVEDRPRPKKKLFREVMSQEIIDAAYGRGRIVKIKDDVHRLAQANKAYAHYRWG